MCHLSMLNVYPIFKIKLVYLSYLYSTINFLKRTEPATEGNIYQSR